MRLIALVESPEHVCCRYRLAAFRPFLQRALHELELLAWPTGWWSWLRVGHSLRSADAVTVQRRLLPSWQLHIVRRASRVLLYDFDDAVFLRDSYATKGLHSRRRLRRFMATIQAADAVIAGNAFLAEQAVAAARQPRVRVIPTCVDPDRYPLAQHTRSPGNAELVWVGSSSTLRGLETIRPLLEQLGHELPGLRLKLVCDRFLHLQQLPVHECLWSETTEAADIAAADIGISWLPDDLWSQGKCGLKVLQYMAAGLPVVANSVGVQKEMVRHGETGFLAETPGQWVEAVGRLARDPELRRRMGGAARRRVEADYSVAVGAAKWLELLERWDKRSEAA